METQPGKGYALSGKIMLIAIVVLFIVVVFMVGFHLYARWYLIRLRQRRRHLNRMRRGGRRAHHILVYGDIQQQGTIADRGLEKKVLNSLPVYVYSSEIEPPPECAVCLSEFEEKEVVRHLPKCNHSFHIECIDMWFHSHSTCPLCRSPVEPVAIQDKHRTVFTGSESVIDEPESGSISGGEPLTHEEESGGRRKGMELIGVKIEIPTRSELNNELAQSSTGFRSPGNHLLSLKRILSMNIKSPASSGSGATPRGCGTADLDLERGLGELNQESSRVRTAS